MKGKENNPIAISTIQFILKHTHTLAKTTTEIIAISGLIVPQSYMLEGLAGWLEVGVYHGLAVFFKS